ncbi:DUF3977 family protein [Patescibacteria group bacterium]|nr:DUF3977 family protein [Patescibacteria group bacterium]MDE1946972.1 DUF3977 family protein [Patescibacteria group bacterium]MDE2233409.1 DUF3977 family protein [Patescibacteria group bacterium]
MKKVFAEIGFGNNSFFSTEYEEGDKEYRVPKFIMPGKIHSLYFRFWIFKKVFILSTNHGIEIKYKEKKRLKILLGISGESKTLKFTPELSAKILSGDKTSTWRLFDDKDLQKGDRLIFINKGTGEQFGHAIITSLNIKTLGTLTDGDWIGHERFPSEAEMYAAYRKYYGDKVSKDSEVKIISFDFKSDILLNSKAYDVVLVPETKITNEAIKISHDLEKFGTYFTLDNKTYFPHVSIYMLQIKDSDLDKVFGLLNEVAKGTRTITGTPRLFGTHNNYIDVEYEKTEEMRKLQMNVVNLLNPLRDGLRDRDKERLLTATGVEKETILKYGYRSVGEFFEPHLTFTRFKIEQKDTVNNMPNMSIFSGNFPEIGIYEMGDNGTCVKEIKKWKLG